MIQFGCFRTDDDGSGHFPEVLDILPGFFAGDPFGIPGSGGDFAIQRHGHFQDAIRFFAGDPLEKGVIQFFTGLTAHPGLYADPGFFQNFHAPPGMGGIGVQRPDDDL